MQGWDLGWVNPAQSEDWVGLDNKISNYIQIMWV